MPKVYSTEEMIDQLVPLLAEFTMTRGSRISSFEHGFILSMKHAKERGRLTRLSDKQVDILDRLHEKHCRS